jgi:hypothetical protein
MKTLKLFMIAILLMSTNWSFAQDHQHQVNEKNGEEFIREVREDSYLTLSIEERAEVHQKDTVVLIEPKYKPSEQKVLESMIEAAKTANKSIPSDSILTIPVVVHIIHKGESIGSGSNISDEQIFSAITRTNEHLQNLDGDGEFAVDTKLQLCLANVDPDGNETNGINRISGCSIEDYCTEGITAGQGQGANEMNVKNLSRWPNQEYYNIWVVAEIENNGAGGGIQGYGYLPTTSPADGIVILYNAFGTTGNLKSYTNKNATLTHEFGHAFALFHTFQGESCDESNCNIQGDRVCDTPPTTLNSSCSAPACFGSQQVENFMDYTSQTCKNTFTAGQTERMRLAIENSRSNLINNTSSSCASVETSIEYKFDLEKIVCDTERDLVVELKNTGENPLYEASFEYGSSFSNILSFDWIGFLPPNDSTKFVFEADSSFKRIVGMRSTSINAFDGVGPLVKDSSKVGNNQIKFITKPDILGGQNQIHIYELNPETKVFESDVFPNFANGQSYVNNTCLQAENYRVTFTDLLGDGFNAPYSAPKQPFFKMIWVNAANGPDTLISVDQNTFTCDSVYFLSQNFSFIGCNGPEELFILYFDINGHEITEDQALKETEYFRHTYFSNQTVKRQKIIDKK